MFGLILAWAFADTTQTVEAKMPTLPTAIRARFIVYLPLDAIGSGKYREKGECSKRCQLSFVQREPRPSVWHCKERSLGWGFENPTLSEGSTRKTHEADKYSSRNVRHKQPVGHALLEMSDHCAVIRFLGRALRHHDRSWAEAEGLITLSADYRALR